METVLGRVRLAVSGGLMLKGLINPAVGFRLVRGGF